MKRRKSTRRGEDEVKMRIKGLEKRREMGLKR